MNGREVFISYSQKDKDRVSLFASLLSKNGYNVWMDVKNIRLGDSIISEVVKGLDNAEIYIIFISHNSNESQWVTEELSIAFSKYIELKKPKIIPVLLDDCKIPTILLGRTYLDARKSIQAALLQLNMKLERKNREETGIYSSQYPVISAVTFGLSKDTFISIGPICSPFTIDDLISDRETIIEKLRKISNGILMNFIPLNAFDLQSPIPKYMNGMYEESIERISGNFSGSYRERITVYVSVFNPNLDKITNLIKDTFSITSLIYTFSLPLPQEDLEKKCIERLQNRYSIIAYDFVEGVTIEYITDFFLSIKCTNENIKLKIYTKYDFAFTKTMSEFSPNNFINWLTE